MKELYTHTDRPLFWTLVFADAWVNMGNIHFARKELVEAQRCYRLAIDLNSQHAKAHFNLGNVMDELNSNLEAVRCYHKSMQADPEFPDVYYNLAITSEKLEEWENAIQYWRTYLNFDTGHQSMPGLPAEGSGCSDPI